MDSLVLVGVLLSFAVGGIGFVALLAFSFVAARRSGPAHAEIVAGLQQRLPGTSWHASRVDGLLTVVEGRSLRLQPWPDGDASPPVVHNELSLDLTGLVDELLRVAGSARGACEAAVPDFARHFAVSDARPLMQQVFAQPEVQASLLRLARAGTKVGILEQRLRADRVNMPWEPEQVGDFVEEALAVARALSRAGHALVQARVG